MKPSKQKQTAPEKGDKFPVTDFSIHKEIPQPPLDRGYFELKEVRRSTKDLQKKTNQKGSGK